MDEPCFFRSGAKLSSADGDIYTVKRALVGSIQQYLFCAIDFRTGETVVEKLIGGAYALDTFQLAGVIGPNGVLDQPTISGIIQVRPGTGGRGRTSPPQSRADPGRPHGRRSATLHWL